MAQTGYTPILLYGSTTASNTPLAADLTTGSSGVELAVNAADGKLFYKDTGGTVRILASKDSSGGTFSNVTITGGTINGTVIGGVTPAAGTFTTLTLTTALAVGQGGTGATTASGARTNLSAAQSGANSDITSLSGLTTALSVLQGGTGSTTASGARTNLSAAQSGANSDITSLSGLTTALSVAQGGTGTTTSTGTGSVMLSTTPTVIGARETKVTVSASNIDLSTANYFSKTISTTTTFTVSNVPTTGTVASLVLDLTNGGSATINWWSGVKWPGGIAPVLTTSGRDVLGFFTYDGGTTWTGLLLGRDVK